MTTNSITQEFSRRVISNYLGDGGLSLILACPDHPWTKSTADAAAVRIAMTVAETGQYEGTLLEVTREARLDSDLPELEYATTRSAIHADLSIGADVTSVGALLSNEGLSSPGVKLHGAGFIVTPQEAEHLGRGSREGLDQHIRPYRNGRDLLQVSRGVMVMDFDGLSERDVRVRFPEAYQHLLTRVKPERDTNREAYRRENWWLFGRRNTVMRAALAGLPRYIATVETAKHRVFQFLDADILPDNMLIAIGSDDAAVLGILSSKHHVHWMLGVGGTLEDRPRYNKSLCFDPFPFPDATVSQLAAIRDMAEELEETRKLALAETPGLTMTEIYNLRDKLRSGAMLDFVTQDRAMRARAGIVAKLHDDIDLAVADAYGWPVDLAPAAIVSRLVELNKERAAEEAAGHVRWLRPDYQIPRFGAPAAKGKSKPA